MDKNRVLWNKCVKFHGHECGGLTIGYKAALYAIELLGLQVDEDHESCLSHDEEIVCISENDACGCDAIQAILGCTVGKGNLLFHIRGKQAFSFYNRKNGKSARLVLKPRPEGLSKGQSFGYYQGLEPKDMFDVMAPKLALPKEASIFASYNCACCGEKTGANWIRVVDGQMLCIDCCEQYDRFNV